LGAIGIILAMLLTLGSLGLVSYYGYDYLHNQMDINFFFTVVILFFVYAILVKIMGLVYKQLVK